MASRFFMPHPRGCDRATAAVSPAFDAAWTDTSVAVRAKCSTSKLNVPRVNFVGISETSTSAHNFLAVQYVSDPLSAQTIAGTVKGIIPSRESSASANACAQIVIRVVSNDGSTFRGTLRAAIDTALSSEFDTASPVYASRKYPRAWSGAGTALSSVDAQAGDRLVIEIGVRFDNTSATAFTAQIALGDNAGATDAPEDETSADLTHVPWVEFSQTLVFAANYTLTTSSITPSTYPGTTYLQAIDDATINCDVLYLFSGTYTGGAYAQTTTRSKFLRIRPAPGVSREEVLLGGFGGDPWFTNANWVSFEDVTFTGSTKFQGHHVQFIGCRNKSGMQIREGCRHVTVQSCRMGGESGAELFGTVIATTPPSTSVPRITDVWILGNDIGHVNGSDCIDYRHFDHLVVEDNEFHDLIRTVGDHTDAFRTFLGGTYLVFRRNHLESGYDGQGFFIGGGTVNDILVENNFFGSAAGSFRAFAIDDNTDRFRIINNSFQEGGSFSNDSAHPNTVMFNNAFAPGASIGRVVGTSIGWSYQDYNYLGATPTGVTPGANEPVTGVTFNDAANGDYRLTAASNGLNFGIASAVGVFAPTTDAEGNARAFPCEAGALERQAGDP